MPSPSPLNFATSGTLQSVNVKVGDHVKKGQLIATLDPSSAELTLEEAEANVTSAEDNFFLRMRSESVVNDS